MKKNAIGYSFMPFEKMRHAAVYFLIFLSVWNLPAISQDENGYFVAALALHNDQIYIGGYFKGIGGIKANNIAAWNIKTWNFSSLGRGLDSTVRAIVIDKKGGVFVGGNFNRAGDLVVNGIAHWSGKNWIGLRNGMEPSAVNSLCLDDHSNLYAGGEFTKVDGQPWQYAAGWNGKNWSKTDGLNDAIRSVVSFKNSLYGSTEQRVLRWNGQAWNALGQNPVNISGTDSGLDTLGSLSSLRSVGSGTYSDRILSLMIFNNELYEVGRSQIWKWTDDRRFSLTREISETSFTLSSFRVKSYSQSADIDAITVSDKGEMYAAYSYYYREIDIGWMRYGLAKWDSSAKRWLRTNVLFNGYINVMLIKDGLLYVGGSFTTINGNAANLFGQLKLSEINFDLQEEEAYEQPPLLNEAATTVKIVSISSRQDSAAMISYIYERLESINDCYKKERKKDLSLKGHLKIDVKVNSKNRVIGIKTLEDNTGGSLIAKCVESKMRSWLLPNSSNDSAELQLEFTFQPPQE